MKEWTATPVPVVISGFSDSLPPVASLGKFGEIGMMTDAIAIANARSLAFLEVSAAAGSVRQIYRLISSIGTRFRGRGREGEREVTDYF